MEYRLRLGFPTLLISFSDRLQLLATLIISSQQSESNMQI